MDAGVNEEIASYLPRQLLARVPHPPRLPHTRELQAAVLSADISGFTKLADRLVHEPEGVERLSRVLNGFYGELIEILEAHGGELVTIVGDGVISVWPADDRALQAAVDQAASCGLAISQKLDGYRPDDGTALRVRTGLGTGTVALARLGSVEHWELLISGDAVAQAVAADRRAAPGAFAVSAPSWRLLSPTGLGRELPAHFVELTRYPEHARRLASTGSLGLEQSALLSYLPAPVRARVTSDAPAWQAELRHISVVFANLHASDGSTVDLESAQQALTLLQGAAVRYGGAFDKLVFDDKGMVGTLVFGLPPYAHEDDPLRAVSSALAVHVELRASACVADIGVATGRVFWGAIGSASRRQYCLVGSVMSLGARLMQGAHDEVLCCPSTRTALLGRIDGDELGPQPLKGFSEPIAIFRARGVGRPEHREHRSVGRESERARLAQMVARAHDGEAALLWIEGAPGLGKSALVAELPALGEHSRVRVLIAAGDAIDRSTPYHAFGAALCALLELDPAAPAAQRARDAVRWVAAHTGSSELCALLGPALGLEIAESALSARLDGQLRADRTAELIATLFDAAGAAGLLLVLEDLHWFDSASLRVALVIHKRLLRVPLLVTTRPLSEPADELYDALRADAERLELRPLPDESITAIVAERLGAARVSQAVQRLLCERAEGNPLFAESLARELLDAGALRHEHGELALQPGFDRNTSQIPRSLDAVIGSRIDRLEAGTSLTLKAASAVGRKFDLELVLAVHPAAPDAGTLQNELDALETLGLIVATDSERVYAFDHAVTHDVTYGRMPSQQRRELHLRIASQIARRDEPQASHDPLLAHHHERAGQGELACQALERAAERALRSGAFREAVGFLERALSIYARAEPTRERFLVDALRRARWHRQLGEALDALGDKQRMGEQAQAALALIGCEEPRDEASKLLATLRDALAQTVRTPRVAGLVGSLPRTLDASAAFELTRACQTLGAHHYYALSPLGMVHNVLRATSAAEHTASAAERGKCYAGMGLLLGVVGQQRLARGYARRAVATVDQADDLGAVTRTHMFAALYYVGVAAFQEVERECAAAQRAADLRDDHTSWGEAQAIAIWSRLYRGQRAELTDAIATLRERALRADNPQLLAWARRFEASELLARGAYAEACTAFDEVLSALRAHGDLPEQLVVMGSLALALVRDGQPERARELIDDALATLSRMRRPTSHIVLQGLCDLLDALRELRATARGSERATLGNGERSVLRALRSYAKSFPIGAPRYQRYEGLAHRDAGHRLRARLALQRGLHAAQRLGLPREQASLENDLRALA